jgi:hypothetical protein
MLARARSVLVGCIAVAALLALTACSSSTPVASNAFGATPTTIAASTAGDVGDPWSAPPDANGQPWPSRPAPTVALQPPPQALSDTWTTGNGMPPPPPPPDNSLPVVGLPSAGPWTTPPPSPAPTTWTTPAPQTSADQWTTPPQQPVAGGPCPQPCPPAAAPAPSATSRRIVPQRSYSGCGLPCADGISQWHVRGVIGRSFSEGTDSMEDCTYYGADIGRTFCGCWGLDAYYRYNTGRFTRDVPAGRFLDGGEWHHIGAKFTYERGFSKNSRLYYWGGVGGGLFWTDKYIDNDSGPEVFGEAGLGYVLSKNWRVRAGVNVHGMDTSVTRRLPVNDGRSRWLWIIAPVAEIEADF